MAGSEEHPARRAAGRGVQREVLDSQVTLTHAGFNLVAALAGYRSAAAMWLKTTGHAR